MKACACAWNLICTMLVALAAPSLSTAEPGQIAVQYEFVNSNPLLHEPVRLNVLVRNDSTTPIKLNLGENNVGNFVLAFSDPDGVRREIPKLTFSVAGFYENRIDPGQSHTIRLLLNRWTQFQKTGRYLIEVRLDRPIENMRGEGIMDVPTFRGSVEVQPADPVVLSQRCALLLSEYEAAPTGQAAGEAAATLMYVDDPVAVPYLGKALQSGKNGDRALVEALARIGNLAAVTELSTILEQGSDTGHLENTSLGYRRSLIVGALTRIDARTTDPATKQAISSALGSLR